MRVTYEVVGNNLSEDSPTWGKVQNAAVLYTDGLTIDRNGKRYTYRYGRIRSRNY